MKTFPKTRTWRLKHAQYPIIINLKEHIRFEFIAMIIVLVLKRILFFPIRIWLCGFPSILLNYQLATNHLQNCLFKVRSTNGLLVKAWLPIIMQHMAWNINWTKKLIRKLNGDLLTSPKAYLHEDCQKQNAGSKGTLRFTVFSGFRVFLFAASKTPAKTENWFFSAHPPISSVHIVRSSREEAER